MICPNCGTSNLDNASICVNCGRALAPQQVSYTPPPPAATYATPAPPAGTPIPNYLVQSILVTLCCCLPLGVVAIIFAAQVNSKVAAGDIAGAMQASKNAKLWALIGFAIGLLAMVLWMVFGGLTALQAIRENMGH